MQRFRVRYVIVIILLAAAAALVMPLRLQRRGTRTEVSINNVPLSIDGWQAEDFEVLEETEDILETSAIILRTYHKGPRKLFFSVVYYRRSRVAMHLPESCSVGQGEFIASRKVIRPAGLEPMSAHQIVLGRDEGGEVIVYYFETEGLRTASYRSLRWNMVLRKLARKTSGAALVRFSTPIVSTEEEATSLIEEFMREAAPRITEVLFRE